jgi:hypothetical protein
LHFAVSAAKGAAARSNLPLPRNYRFFESLITTDQTFKVIYEEFTSVIFKEHSGAIPPLPPYTFMA